MGKLVVAQVILVMSATLLGPIPRGSAQSADQIDCAQVYSNDFEAGVGSEWSSTAIDSTPIGGRHFLGQFGSDAITLTLSGLPAHGQLKVSFDVFVIRTWDGSQGQDPVTGATVGPDVWTLQLGGGPTVVETTFSNIDSDPPRNYPQAYPDSYPAGMHPPKTGAVESGTLGYSLDFGATRPATDAVYHIDASIAHGTAGVAIVFAGVGLQSVSDESWGLDNVAVSVCSLSSPTPTSTQTDTPTVTPTPTPTATIRQPCGFSSAPPPAALPCDFSSPSGQERCFGGIGPGCNGVTISIPLGNFSIRFIKNAQTCLISGAASIGSILHDQCCFKHPLGYSCQRPYRGSSDCLAEWRLAERDVVCARAWPQIFGPYPVGSIGDNPTCELRAPQSAKIDVKYARMCRSGVCTTGPTGRPIVYRQEDTGCSWCVCK